MRCWAAPTTAAACGTCWPAARRPSRQRATIAHAIGPVWEANHVWLILAIVVAVHRVPARVRGHQHVPPRAAAVRADRHRAARIGVRVPGLRSGRPAPRAVLGPRVRRRQHASPRCSSASSSGRSPRDGCRTTPQRFVRRRVHPSVADAVLAGGRRVRARAVRLPGGGLPDDGGARRGRAARRFDARALASGVVVFVLAVTVLLLSRPTCASALLASAWAVPLHVATGASAVAAFACLWRRRYELARLAAAAQVTSILWGWALAQYPYAIRPHLTLADAAAPAERAGAAAAGARASAPSSCCRPCSTCSTSSARAVSSRAVTREPLALARRGPSTDTREGGERVPPAMIRSNGESGRSSPRRGHWSRRPAADAGFGAQDGRHRAARSVSLHQLRGG